VVQWEEQRKENFVLTSYQEENRRLVVRVTSKYMRFMQFVEFLKKDKKSHYLDCCSFLFRSEHTRIWFIVTAHWAWPSRTLLNSTLLFSQAKIICCHKFAAIAWSWRWAVCDKS